MPISRVSGFWRKLGFTPGALVEAVGHSGGIWVLCRVGLVVLQVEKFSQAVTVRVGGGGNGWFLSAIYGSPTPSIREELWHHLCQKRGEFQTP